MIRARKKKSPFLKWCYPSLVWVCAPIVTFLFGDFLEKTGGVFEGISSCVLHASDPGSY